jgi:hypothetical protein
MKYLLFAGILVFMFFSSGTIAVSYGLKNIGVIYTLIFTFIFFIKLLSDKNKLFFSKYKEEVGIVLIGGVIIFIKIFLGQLAQINEVFNFFMMPMFLSFLLGTQNKFNTKIIKNLILIFFIAECFLAIYERIFLINLFPSIILDDEVFIENWGFRSSSFLGNPLANALCVSTIMGFILVDSMKITYKLFYLILGFVSLMCFNGRGALIIWVLLAFIYILNVIRKNNNKKIKLLAVIFMMTSSYFVYNLMVNYDIGSRILNDGLIDGSSKTRIEVFDAFNYIDSSDLWFGNAQNYEKVGGKLGVNSVENSFIVLIIKYGVIMFSIFFVLYYKWIKKLLKNYSGYNKFFILSSFLLLGSTNNALAGSQSWFFLVICFYSFPIISQVNNIRKFNYKLINAK